MGGYLSCCKPKPVRIPLQDGEGNYGKKIVEVKPSTPVKETTKSKLKVDSVPLGKLTEFGYSTNFKQRHRQGKLLGHGQFGYTYVATDLCSGEKVAVKTIEKNKMVTAVSVEDVKREVKIMRALSGHENVVQLHEAFEDDDYVYIVMELCEGGELLDRILAKFLCI